MPQGFRIGTKSAFDKGYEYAYQKKEIISETVYVCTKGSDWARADEVLVLRRESETWTAFDSALTGNGTTLTCRQGVFRCKTSDITKPGYHEWEMNKAANSSDEVLEDDWQGALWCETRVP